MWENTALHRILRSRRWSNASSSKKEKPYIVVFCEGESEQAYIDFLKEEFRDVASIKRPSATGLFEVADDKFKKDKKYRDYTEVTDEIWFFFDVETKDISTWDAHIKIIKKLRSLRKNLISELDF